MQVNRLFHIVYYLLENGTCTAPELAEKFEVSVRTIYRDLDTLSAAGIPIYATQGKGGGISLLSDFILEKSLLSEKEKEQILMSLQGISATEGESTDKLCSKLSALFQVKNTEWFLFVKKPTSFFQINPYERFGYLCGHIYTGAIRHTKNKKGNSKLQYSFC